MQISFIYFDAYTLAQVAKLERHLSLLRQEYVKLQNRLIDVEKKYSLAVAASGQTTGEHENTFVNRLLKTVAELYDKDLYRWVKLFFCIHCLRGETMLFLYDIGKERNFI